MSNSDDRVDGAHDDDVQSGNDEMNDETNSADTSHNLSRVRGAALIRKIMSLTSGGTKIKLTLNDDGKPVGDHSTPYFNYVGYLARTMVSIAHKDWRYVPPSTKTPIFDTIMVIATNVIYIQSLLILIFYNNWIFYLSFLLLL